MIRRFLVRLSDFVHDFLQNPLRVFVLSAALVSMGLVLDGSLFRLWSLHRDTAEISSRIQKLRAETMELENKIQRAKDPQFIEMQAREKFDLASEGDLIFVFTDNE